MSFEINKDISDNQNNFFQIPSTNSSFYKTKTNFGFTRTNNIYNKFDISELSGKNKYDNYFLFQRRELEKRNKNLKKKQNLSMRKPFYLTSYKSDFKLKKSKSLKEISFEEIKLNKEIQNDIYKNPSSILLLNIIENQREKEYKQYLEKEKRKKLNRKNNVINLYSKKNNSIGEIINKSREIQTINHSQKMIKERLNILSEKYQNQLEELDDKIISMTQAKNLYDEKYINSINKYIKNLQIKRDEEKTIEIQLTNKILELKKEIQELYNKVKKLDSIKNSLDRWMYLQIQVKEKIKELPSHYKLVLDVKLSNNPILKTVLAEEIERLSNYKGKKIYTAKEFLEEFTKYENDNLKLIDTYNNLQKEIFQLKNIKNKIKSMNKEFYDSLDINLNIQQKLLNTLKEKNKALQKEKNGLLFTLKKTKIRRSVSEGSIKFKSSTNSKLKVKYLNSKLFFKIYEVLNNITKKNFIFEKNAHSTKEREMLIMLKKIEIFFDNLLRVNKEYSLKYVKEIVEIKTKIEKVRKTEKASQQRELLMKKFESIREKIENRVHKVYFLPKKNVEKYYSLIIKTKNQREKYNEKKSKYEFEDYMSNIINND